VAYEHDVVTDDEEIRKRKKKRSRKFRDAFGHTPVSTEEPFPWKCQRLIVGTGAHGDLPVLDDVKREAERRGVELLIEPTDQAVTEFQAHPQGTNAILHVTC
jgi:hypothetical protein